MTEVVLQQVEKLSGGLPYVPVRDRDGWVSIETDEDLAQAQAYFAGEKKRKQEQEKVEYESLVERFEEAVRICEALPEWSSLPDREKTARLLEEVGLKAKAERYRECGGSGIPVDCDCGSRFYSRYQCTLRSCPNCGRVVFNRLMDRYCQPIADLIAKQPTQHGQTLAMITLSVRSSGRMPHPDDAKLLNKLVRRFLKKVVPRGSVWGAVFTIEVGHELAKKHPERASSGWNLHVHVLYYGPYLDWDAALLLWKKLTDDEGQGLWIKQCLDWRRDFKTAVRRALIHHFGYVLKPAGVSGERIAALEVLWTGVRRVHAVGAFYKLPKPPKKNRRCPDCGRDLRIQLDAWRRDRRVPVAFLEAEGRRDLDAVGRRSFGGRGP
jgi:ribosomal protein S27AE